jgi:hypothetical protein
LYHHYGDKNPLLTFGFIPYSSIRGRSRLLPQLFPLPLVVAIPSFAIALLLLLYPFFMLGVVFVDKIF